MSVTVLQAGEYVWLTYKEAYDIVIELGASIRCRGVGQVILFDVLFFRLLSCASQIWFVYIE